MKCPNRKINLPDTALFPHKYAKSAEYLLKMMEYNMRVYMLAMIKGAALVDRKYIVTPKQVLMCAIQAECERVARDAGSHLAQDVEITSMLRELNLHTT